LHRSRVAGAIGASRWQVAIVLETVIATGPMFPQWNTRTAARKGGCPSRLRKRSADYGDEIAIQRVT